jgi:DNA-binding response OmpR family regulator
MKGASMPQTCLIAAHDPWFIQLLRIYTEETGLRITQVFEGQDVIPMIRRESPAVLLLQMDLPGQIKSLEVLQSLKNDPKTSQIPVLIFSWQGMVDGLVEGVATHLQGPITYEAFVEALRKVGIACAPRPEETK